MIYALTLPALVETCQRESAPPVSYPAGVAVRALALNGVTVVTVFTGGTHLLAVFTKEALGAELVTAGPVPAPVAGDAAALSHLAGLLALTVSTPAGHREQPPVHPQALKHSICMFSTLFLPPVPAVLTIKSSRTGLPAELPAVSWCAGTRAIHLVALAVDTLTVPVTPRTPQPLVTQAPCCELLAR